MNGVDSHVTGAAAPVALAVVRPDGLITAANPAWERLTGWAGTAVVTRRLQDLVTRGGRLFLETHCLPVLASGTPVEEAAIEIVAPDRRRIPMLLYGRRDPRTATLHIALAPAAQRHAQQQELRQMRDRERRNSDLQALLARLSEEALAGLSPAELSALAARGLHMLLPADLAAVVELSSIGPRLLALAGTGGPAGAGSIAVTDAALAVEAERARELLGAESVIETSGPARGLAAAALTGPVVSLRAAVGDPYEPAGILVVHRQSEQRFTTFEIRAVQAMAQTLWTAFMRFHEVEAVHHRAAHDALTGLANRHQLQQRLDQALRDARHGAARPAVLFVDLDGFKTVNDRHGHHAGDALLRAVADRLREAVRTHDTVARLGGDEFVILCPDVGSRAAAEHVAERVQRAMTRPFIVAGASQPIGASLGLVVASDGDSAAQILADADAAMYGDKARRRRRRAGGVLADAAR